ncbi:MAG TPA: CPBP family intramembrane metalloprotease [bacterium]|nr:CPBP family intramembrane metalloprotease [bacterium]
MKNNRALVYTLSVLGVSFLYSSVYFFIPLKEMAEICLVPVSVEERTFCGIPMSMVFLSFYMFLPLITAVVLQKVVYKEPLRDIGFTFKWTPWYFFAWFAPLVISVMALGMAVLMPGVSYDPQMSGYLEKMRGMLPQEQFEAIQKQIEAVPFNPVIGITQALIAGATLNAFFAFGEEAGWRGFFLKSVSSMNFFRVSVFTGAVWGIWHFPAIIQGHNYPDYPVAGVFLMTIWCILLTPPMIYAVKKTGSIIAAAVFHGTINATAGITVMLTKGGTDLTAGVAGFNSILALVVFNALLVVYDKYYAKEKVIFTQKSH